MNDFEKRGYSPQVQKALGEIIAVSSALNGAVPSGGVFAVGDRLAAWESETARDAQRHKQAMQSRVGHPALKRRR